MIVQYSVTFECNLQRMMFPFPPKKLYFVPFLLLIRDISYKSFQRAGVSVVLYMFDRCHFLFSNFIIVCFCLVSSSHPLTVFILFIL